MDDRMPFIPEFREAAERNRWIITNAQYFTVIRRKNRSYLREECATMDEAEALAKRMLRDDPNARFLIYAVALGHDTLAATVSTDGVKHHQ